MPKYYVLHPYNVMCVFSGLIFWHWIPSECALPWVGPSLPPPVLLSYL